MLEIHTLRKFSTLSTFHIKFQLSKNFGILTWYPTVLISTPWYLHNMLNIIILNQSCWTLLLVLLRPVLKCFILQQFYGVGSDPSNVLQQFNFQDLTYFRRSTILFFRGRYADDKNKLLTYNDDNINLKKEHHFNKLNGRTESILSFSIID